MSNIRWCSFLLSSILLLNSLVYSAIVDNRVDDTISECTKHEDLITCLGTRAIAAIDRASRMSDIPVMDGITLIKERDFRAGRVLMSAEQIEAVLPVDAEERSSKLTDLAYDSVLRFLQSHSLQLRMPQDAPETLQRALEEGRAKIKKKILPILMLIGVKLVALLPLALGAIGLMAVKALFVGKLALIIAAIVAFQKFFAGGSGGLGSFGKVSGGGDWSGGSSGGAWSGGSYGSGGSGPYYKRSMEEDEGAHRFAYSAHIPQNH